MSDTDDVLVTYKSGRGSYTAKKSVWKELQEFQAEQYKIQEEADAKIAELNAKIDSHMKTLVYDDNASEMLIEKKNNGGFWDIIVRCFKGKK